MKNQSNTTSAKGQSETFASLWPMVNVEYKASCTFLIVNFFYRILSCLETGFCLLPIFAP